MRKKRRKETINGKFGLKSKYLKENVQHDKWHALSFTL